MIKEVNLWLLRSIILVFLNVPQSLLPHPSVEGSLTNVNQNNRSFEPDLGLQKDVKLRWFAISLYLVLVQWKSCYGYFQAYYRSRLSLAPYLYSIGYRLCVFSPNSDLHGVFKCAYQPHFAIPRVLRRLGEACHSLHPSHLTGRILISGCAALVYSIIALRSAISQLRSPSVPYEVCFTFWGKTLGQAHVQVFSTPLRAYTCSALYGLCDRSSRKSRGLGNLAF